MKQIKYPIPLLLAVLFLSGCGSLPGQPVETPTAIPVVTRDAENISEGRLVPRQHVNLSFSAPGTVAEVLFEEGDPVEEGQAIARLDQRERFSSAVAQAELELVNARQALDTLNENAEVITAQALKVVADSREAVRQAERRLENLESGSRQTDIDSASADVVLLKDRLDQVKEDFEPYENKPEDNLERAELLSRLAEAQQMYDDAVRLLNNLEGNAGEIDVAIAESNLALAEAQLVLAEQEYEQVKDGPDPDDLAAAQARIKAAETALAAAQAAYDDTELKAPFAGTLAQLNLKTGEQVVPGQTAAVLADFSGWLVETSDLTELEVPEIATGDEALLTFDALPGLELPGVVESISGIDEEKFGDVTYTVRIRLVESDPRLRWGMTAIAHFKD